LLKEQTLQVMVMEVKKSKLFTLFKFYFLNFKLNLPF
jgi:hypothetical protein